MTAAGRRQGAALTTAAVLAALVVAFLLPAAASASDGYYLTGVHVEGGEGYTSFNSFAVATPITPIPTMTAVLPHNRLQKRRSQI